MMKNTFCNGLFYWTGVRFPSGLGKRILFFDTTSVFIKLLVWSLFLTVQNFNTTSVLIKLLYKNPSRCHNCISIQLLFLLNTTPAAFTIFAYSISIQLLFLLNIPIILWALITTMISIQLLFLLN